MHGPHAPSLAGVQHYVMTDSEIHAELNIPISEGMAEVPFDLLYDLRPPDTSEVTL